MSDATQSFAALRALVRRSRKFTLALLAPLA
jgi:hypothetical protein